MESGPSCLHYGHPAQLRNPGCPEPALLGLGMGGGRSLSQRTDQEGESFPPSLRKRKAPTDPPSPSNQWARETESVSNVL